MAERAVYIGGFGNGKRNVERVAHPLAEARNYDDVDTFTFSEAMKNPEVIRRAVKGVDLWTHSAGFMAAKDTSPARIEAFNAPIPSSRTHLLARTCFKLLRMHTPTIGVQQPRDIASVLAYDVSSFAELTAHPKANLGNIGEIARFNAIQAAQDAHKAGIAIGLTYTEGDEYFQPSFAQEITAVTHGVDFTRLKGIHDELVIRPAATLAAHLKKREAQVARRIPTPSLAALERTNYFFSKW